MSTVTYLKNLIKDIKVASITPTSSFGVKKVCKKIDFTRDVVIVEYGPGSGVFTTYLLEQMTPGSKLIAIDTNDNFVQELTRIEDPRFFLVHDSAENVRQILLDYGETAADYIISGIPFSLLGRDLKNRILSETVALLKPGGKFLAYQLHNHLSSHIERHFRNCDTEYEVRNIPPLFVYEAVKR